MELIKYLLLALIQAILEWLPVSSEGFLILTAVNAFQMDSSMALRIAIYFHLGTGLSVLIKYWKTYWKAVTNEWNVLRFLIITTFTTGIVGIPIYLLLSHLLENLDDWNGGLIVSLIIGATLLVTATLLRLGKIKGTDQFSMEERKIGDEIGLGACQGLAILPGISRSGTTVTYLILRGYKKEDAFHMSFIISLPAIVGAIFFDLIIEETPVIFGWEYLLIVGFTALVGYFTMDILLRVARKWSFDVICYILGGITIVLVGILLIFL